MRCAQTNLNPNPYARWRTCSDGVPSTCTIFGSSGGGGDVLCEGARVEHRALAHPCVLLGGRLGGVGVGVGARARVRVSSASGGVSSARC